MLTSDDKIWDFHSEGRYVVITTNIGWKKDETNPMGAGIAQHAAGLFPELPLWYGKRCKKYGSDTAVAIYDPGMLFLFPTKKLEESRPWVSWSNDADINLILRSLNQLVACVDYLTKKGTHHFTKIGVPLVGCGRGGLSKRDVIPILSNKLDDRFVLFGK